jgi:adenylosuccinate lyase
VLSENLMGLARLVRSAATPALENVALWHERDISHSSVERGIAPDATVTLDFALVRLAGMIDKLLIYPERMAANLESLAGVVHSGDVLLALARAGLSREEAYGIVQSQAMETWTRLGTADGKSFRENLDAHPTVAANIAPEVLDAAMNAAQHLKHVDTVFARLFGEG